MRTAEVSMDEAREAVETLTSEDFLTTVKVLADPALRASLEKLAEPASQDVLRDAKDLQDAVKTLVGPELAAALERLNSPAVQEALRKASAELLGPEGNT